MKFQLEIYILLVFLLNFLFAMKLFAPQPPEISVYEIILSDTYKLTKATELPNKGEGEYYSLTGNDLLLSGNIQGINLKCSAKYPVYWKAEEDELDSTSRLEFGFTTHTMREGELEKTPPQLWTYSANLNFWILAQKMTKNYTCRSVHDDEALQTSRYIFTEGNSFNFLLYAGEAFKVSIDSQKFIRGPCRVSVPSSDDMNMTLFKETIKVADPFNVSDWELLKTNDSIKFDPRSGYTFKVQDLPDILGSYKCRADDSNENDVVHFDIIKERLEPPLDIKYSTMRVLLQGSATTYADYNRGTVVCCSNSNKPPKMKMMSCYNPPECDFDKPLVMSDKKHPEWYYNHIEEMTKNCSGSYFHISNFWLSCQGDGIDVFSLYTYTFRNTSTRFDGYLPTLMPKIGYNIEPISQMTSESKVVHVDFVEDVAIGLKNRNELRYFKIFGPTTGLELGMFDGQRILFLCYKSIYYFSDGDYWEVKWKNGSSKRFKSETNLYVDPYSEGYGRLSIVVDLQMASISCYVPRWNSSEWVGKSVDLAKIKESSAPKVNEEPHELLNWYVNETNKILQCSFSGQPIPKINWKKDGRLIYDDEMFSIHENGSYSRLEIIQKITHEFQGTYSCFGTNFRGESIKIFTVSVEENSSLHTVMTVLVVLTVIGVFVGVAAVGWKMRRRSEGLLNLSRSQSQSQSQSQRSEDEDTPTPTII